jgi:hypothetical protein
MLKQDSVTESTRNRNSNRSKTRFKSLENAIQIARNRDSNRLNTRFKSLENAGRGLIPKWVQDEKDKYMIKKTCMVKDIINLYERYGLSYLILN